MFLGNFTPKTSKYYLKTTALGFPGGQISMIHNSEIGNLGINWENFPENLN